MGVSGFGFAETPSKPRPAGRPAFALACARSDSEVFISGCVYYSREFLPSCLPFMDWSFDRRSVRRFEVARFGWIKGIGAFCFYHSHAGRRVLGTAVP